MRRKRSKRRNKSKRRKRLKDGICTAIKSACSGSKLFN